MEMTKDCKGDDCIRILPHEVYDPAKAQAAHHILWILYSAYPEGVPGYLGTPFYVGKDERLVLSPHVISTLVSCDLYTSACLNLFCSEEDAGEDEVFGSDWASHQEILTQLAARWSLYPMEHSSGLDASGGRVVDHASPGFPVNESSLMQTLPFRMGSHLALMESLITARYMFIAPISKVVSCTRQSFPKHFDSDLDGEDESLLPYDVEDALVYWVNHTVKALKATHRENQVIEELVEYFDIAEVSDGLVLASVIACFYPHIIPVIKLSNEKTIDVDLDSTLVNETESNAINAVRNLKLVFQFCDLFQNQRASFPLSTKAQRKKILFLELEDFLYPNQMTKQAIILFIAELFNIMCDQVVTDEPSQIDEGHDQSPPLHDQETFDVSNEDSAEADTMNRERKDSSDGPTNVTYQDTPESRPETDVPDYDIEESIDIGSIKSLHRASKADENDDDQPKVEPISVTESHNLTYVTENKEDEKNSSRIEPNADASKTPLSNVRSTSRIKDPVGSSTPNSRSPEREKELKRRSFPLPHPTTSSGSGPVVQSGKGTYFVKGSSHHHHHRPASDIFLESNFQENALENAPVEPDRPLSEHFTSPFDNQLSNRTTFGTIPNRSKNASRRESNVEDETSKPESQENAPENLKSLRAEMEMKRREIQKQRAYEDREKRKQRQKVSEAAFFKAIQPRSHSAINIESYQNMDDVQSNAGDTDSKYGFSTKRNPSMSDMSIQTSIEASSRLGPGQHGMTPTSPGESHEVYPPGHLGVHPQQLYGDSVAERDLHRTASLDWTKSGLVSPLDAPGLNRGNRSFRSFGRPEAHKSGSTYDLMSLDHRGKYPSHMSSHESPLLQHQRSDQEKMEKQILIEQNINLAQQLKMLKAQYANEIGYSPDYMGSMNGRGPQTAAAMGVTPRNTGGMMAWPGPPQTTQYLHNQQQPPHYIQPPPPPVGAIPTPAHRPPPSAFLTPAPAAGFVPLMPPSAPTTPFIEANAPTRYDGYKQSGQPASSVHDLENGGAGANSPPLSLPSSNENLTLNSSSFVSAPRSNNDPLSRSLGGMEATNVFRRSLSNNNASERRYQSNDSFGVDDIRNDDVDTLEAPYDTPEVVNPLVDYANDMRSPFTATPVPRGSMSSRTGRKTWGDSQNDIRSNSKSRTRLPSEDLTLNGDKGCISARVAPNGVALIIGEETNELKMIDYEEKRKQLLKKRAEKLEADHKMRKQALTMEKERLKEEKRKLQIEIDNHRRQEQLKMQKESDQGRKNFDGGSNYPLEDKEESPNHTNSALRPKAKVAPRVKSSTSNNELGQAQHLPARGPRTEREEIRSERTSNLSSTGGQQGTPLKLYVKPQSRGNKQIIINAINQCVLPGAVNFEQKKKVLREMNSRGEEDGRNFLLLFRDNNMKYRALYSFDPDTAFISKVVGTGPNVIKEDMILDLYKYNSGSKTFSLIPSKTMSVSVDGFTIPNHLWKTGATKKV